MAAITANISCSSRVEGFIDLDVIYFARFWNKTKTRLYRLHIKKTDFNDSATEITNLTPDPLILRHVDVEDSNIQGSEMVFSFIAHKDDFEDYDLLSTGTSFEYEFYLYDNLNLEYMEHLWHGFILPSETNRSYFNNYSVYTITATDFLTRLKEIEFSNYVGLVPRTRSTIIQVIAWALGKLPPYSDTDVYYSMLYAQVGVTENNVTSPTHPLDQLYIHSKIFSALRNGLVVGESCYNVIDNLLKVLNSRLCSWVKTPDEFEASYNTPDFFLTNVDEVESNVSLYAYKGTTGVAFRQKTSSVNNSLNIDAYQFSRESELSRKVPLKSLELLQRNYDFGESFDTDDFSDFDNTAIWTRTSITSISESGGVYTVQVNAGDTGSFVLTDGYAISNTEGNKYFRLSFTVKNTTTYQAQVDPYDDYKANVVVLSILAGNNETGTYLYRSADGITVAAGETKNYISPVTSAFEIKDGKTYKIRINIQNSIGVRNKTFEISGIELNTCYAQNGEIVYNLVYDNVFEGYSEAGLSPTKTIEIKVGDSDVERNAAAITLSTDDTDVTSSWKRYGKTETKYIHELIMQSYFNRFGGSARQLKIKVYDPEDTIKLSKKIVFDSNTYQILDIEKSFATGWVNLKLQQIATSDVSITTIKKYVPPSQATSNSSSGVASGNPSWIIATSHAKLSGLGADDHPQYLLRSESIVSLTTGTTLDMTYAGKIVECSGTFTVTLPNGMPTGMKVDIVNIGTGTITIAASTTLQSESSKTKLATRYTGASAYHRGSNVWLLVGKIST